MSSAKIWLVCGALLGGTAVALGAYRAHSLETKLQKELGDDPASRPLIAKRLADCETAIRYQMFQALALLVVGLLAEKRPTKCLTAVGICFLLGLILFAGPLYLLSLFDVHLHSAVIPSGGGLLIVGWMTLLVAMIVRPIVR